jgi:hypothetical protein
MEKTLRITGENRQVHLKSNGQELSGGFVIAKISIEQDQH